MIMWTLSLSGQQMALLRMYSLRRDDGKDDFWTRGKEREMGVHPNTIPGSRTLIREGLLEHRTVKLKNTDYQDAAKSGYFVTERGRFILAMIQTDIDKYLTAEGQIATKKKSQLKRVS